MTSSCTPLCNLVKKALKPATRRFETLADPGDVHLAVTAGAIWVGLAADDSPFVLNDTGTSEIYTLEWEAP